MLKIDPKTPGPKKVLINKVKTDFLTQKIAQEEADKLKDEDEKGNGDQTASKKQPERQ